MRIGVVGKPNVGKSTFFSALTLASVDIANYPFCTIIPNIGIAYIPTRQPCPCRELRIRLESEGRLEPANEDDPRKGSLCTPRTGMCIGHARYIPISIVDIAGLVPGAHLGRGQGNAFLNDLAQSDALIHILDGAGSTDKEGQFIGAQTEAEKVQSLLVEEIEFFTHELDAWIAGILADGWTRGVRRVQAEGERGLISFLNERLSGIGGSYQSTSNAYQSFMAQSLPSGKPWEWGDNELLALATHMRKSLFPIVHAANKWDISPHPALQSLPTTYIRPCMADMELGLRRAAHSGLINYFPGENDFTVSDVSIPSEAQLKALHHMQDHVRQWDGTGVFSLLDYLAFDLLHHMVVYPVQDELHWVDGEGRILPDVLLVPNGSQAKQIAYHVHTDLGDGFIRGIDGRTKRVVGAEHELKDNDILKIHAKA